ncbi:MAG TPA: hypothetical protein VGA37_13250 [Gemmatimonadales bacterium]
MTTAVHPADSDRSDVRTIVGSGVILGIVTTIGVVAFALLSRSLDGTGEIITQSVLIMGGGVMFSFFPAMRSRPRSADGIAWAALIGLLGALVFTVFDAAALRPVHLYHWTWDEIGGGSGLWYIPVWWMGSALLAWLGSMVVGYSARSGRDPQPLMVGVQTAGLGVILFGITAAMGILPFHPAVAALAFTVALILHVPLSAVMHRP